ncbi:GNAT family N-acetyltransferase [Actinomadura nitritigenes]|uniref:GNAT family N-acetyltransferase n=1 Tax=Actinomadura nitritigenes TaxID=134602 RepID=UPI003D8A0738
MTAPMQPDEPSARFADIELEPGGLRLRTLEPADAPLLVEATSAEPGIASRAVRAVTLWARDGLAVPRIWLEIEPGNEPSLRVAERAGYRFEQRIPHHCRAWEHEDADRDTWHDCLIWPFDAAPL